MKAACCGVIWGSYEPLPFQRRMCYSRISLGVSECCCVCVCVFVCVCVYVCELHHLAAISRWSWGPADSQDQLADWTWTRADKKQTVAGYCCIWPLMWENTGGEVYGLSCNRKSFWLEFFVVSFQSCTATSVVSKSYTDIMNLHSYGTFSGRFIWCCIYI